MYISHTLMLYEFLVVGASWCLLRDISKQNIIVILNIIIIRYTIHIYPKILSKGTIHYAAFKFRSKVKWNVKKTKI